MAVLEKKLKEFDKEFRAQYFRLLKELQTKKPKNISLEFSTDPYDESEEAIQFLNSKGIRQSGEKEYVSPTKFVYSSDPPLTLEQMKESLDYFKTEIERYGIEIDWSKILGKKVGNTKNEEPSEGPFFVHHA